MKLEDVPLLIQEAPSFLTGVAGVETTTVLRIHTTAPYRLKLVQKIVEISERCF